LPKANICAKVYAASWPEIYAASWPKTYPWGTQLDPWVKFPVEYFFGRTALAGFLAKDFESLGFGFFELIGSGFNSKFKFPFGLGRFLGFIGRAFPPTPKPPIKLIIQ
jgi:hypothetical protein